MAKAKFHQEAENSGAHGISNYYLKLCERYEKNPPSEEWDGVIDLEEK